jgi:hypothetical protein
MLRAFPAMLLCFSLLTSSVLAYDTELSDTAVREAYFLGQRGGDKTRDFFALYTKHPLLPKKGPNISEIRLLTPLAQVVQISSQVTSGYSAQQAALDYKARGDTILLVVHIEFTPTYGPFDAGHAASDASRKKGITLRPDEFWQDFRYGIKQRAGWIEPRSIHGEPDYGASDAFGNGGLVGAWVYIEYDAHTVASDDTDVSVFTIDDQEIQTTFDLAKLR